MGRIEARDICLVGRMEARVIGLVGRMETTVVGFGKRGVVGLAVRMKAGGYWS